MGPIILAIVYLVTLICVVTTYIWLTEYYELYRTLGHIPGPRNYPFIGSMWRIKKLSQQDTFKWFNNLCFTFQNGIVVTWFGIKPVVNIRKPHQIQIILSRNELVTKSRFYNFMTPWLGNGLLTSTGLDNVWYNHRQLITQALHFGILEEYITVMHDKVKVLIEIMHSKIEMNPNASINIFDLVMKYSLDTICETAMGIDMDIQRKPENDYIKAFYKCCKIAKDRYFNFWIRWDFVFYRTKSGINFLNAVECMHKLTEKVIKQKQKDRIGKKQSDFQEDNQFDEFGKRKRKAFLDFLLDINQYNDCPLTLEEIRQEVDTFIFAGYDTTSAAIIWTLFVLGNSPDVQARVQAEVNDIFGDIREQPTIEQLSQLQYLNRVIKEVLRLYPSLPLISRLLDYHLVIDNYYIPERTLTNIQVYQLHHDPEIWKNPEVFDPDRFLPENSHQRHPYAYIPFGDGPRNCIGQKFAILEIKIVVTKILRIWKVKSALKPTEVKLVSDFILKPFNNKINLYFTSINNAHI